MVREEEGAGAFKEDIAAAAAGGMDMEEEAKEEEEESRGTGGSYAGPFLNVLNFNTKYLYQKSAPPPVSAAAANRRHCLTCIAAGQPQAKPLLPVGLLLYACLAAGMKRCVRERWCWRLY